MTSRAKSDEILQREAKLRGCREWLDVVGMKRTLLRLPDSVPLAAETVASPDSQQRVFPLLSLVEALALRRNSSLPSWVFASLLQPSVRLRGGTTCDSMSFHLLDDGGGIHPNFCGYVRNRASAFYVHFMEPFSGAVRRWLSVARPRRETSPTTPSSIPFHLLTATASTQRRFFGQPNSSLFGSEACLAAFEVVDALSQRR